MSKATKRLVGLAAIVGAVLIVVLGVVQPNPFRQTDTYWAEFTSAQGLGAIGRDVRVAGVNVGTIGEVKREGDNAVVELNLDEPIVLHTDSRADMRPHTLFEGSSFIDLFPGSPSAPLLETGEMIPIEQTSNYITLDEALRILRPEIRDSLRDLAETGSKTLQGGAIEGIQKTLKGAPELTRRLGGPARALQGPGREELAGAIAGMAKTVDAVAERENDLIPLTQRVNRTMAALTVDGSAPLDSTLAALPGALDELNRGAPELTGLVDRLDTFSGEINSALPDLTEALRQGTPLFERTIPVLRKATPLVADLRKVGGRLAAAAPTLAKLIRTLDPVTRDFGESVLPVLLSPSRNGPPVYEQLLATFTAADAVFRPYQTPEQNPNGFGHVWNIGTYLDPGLAGLLGGGGGLPLPRTLSCEQVGEISLDAAKQLQAAGGCQ